MDYKKNSLKSEMEEMNIALSTRIQDDDGNIKEVEERVSGADIIRQKHENMVRDDRTRSSNRSKVDAMLDYKPPHDPVKFKNAGRAGQFNLNFGEGDSILHTAIAPYVDMFTSTETLINLPLKPEVVNEEDLNVSQELIAEEFTRMVRRWDDGLFNYLELVTEFASHGVGIAMTLDKNSWHFDVTGLSNFYFPKRTKATASSVEFCTFSTHLNPSDLEEKIRNEKASSMLGWDIEEVKRVLARFGATSNKYDQLNSEQQYEQTKASDTNTGSIHETIEVIYAWCKEADGKVSQYITTRDAYKSKEDMAAKVKCDKFLFRSHKCYDSMRSAINIFNYYTGTKGNIHTIRGLGSRVFPHIQTKNLMQCATLDSARDSMSTKYKVNSDKNLSDAPIVYQGANTLISSHVEISQQQHTADLQKNAMPVLEMLSNQISQKSAASAISDNLTSKGERRSALEVGSAIEFYGSLNASAMNLFFISFKSLLVEMAKRAFRATQDTQTEAGRAAKRMQEKLLQKGVTREEMDNIDYDEAAVPIPVGMGNSAAREAKFNAGASLLGDMDDVGRKRFAMDRAIAIYGPEQAKRYINANNVQRPPIDQKIAELENNQILAGMQVKVDPSENFVVHLRTHLEPLMQMMQAYQEGEMPIEDAAQQGYGLFEHCNETMSIAIVPDVDIPELSQMKQALQQVGEVIENGVKALQNAAREAAEQGEEQAPQGEQQASEEQQKAQEKQANFQLEMQMKQAKHQQELAMKEQEFNQKMIQMNQEHSAKIEKMRSEVQAEREKFAIRDTPAERNM